MRSGSGHVLLESVINIDHNGGLPSAMRSFAVQYRRLVEGRGIPARIECVPENVVECSVCLSSLPARSLASVASGGEVEYSLPLTVSG